MAGLSKYKVPPPSGQETWWVRPNSQALPVCVPNPGSWMGSQPFWSTKLSLVLGTGQNSIFDQKSFTATNLFSGTNFFKVLPTLPTDPEAQCTGIKVGDLRVRLYPWKFSAKPCQFAELRGWPKLCKPFKGYRENSMQVCAAAKHLIMVKSMMSIQSQQALKNSRFKSFFFPISQHQQTKGRPCRNHPLCLRSGLHAEMSLQKNRRSALPKGWSHTNYYVYLDNVWGHTVVLLLSCSDCFHGAFASTHTHTHTDICKCICAYTHTHTHTHTNSLTTHTHAHTQTHKQTNTHTHTLMYKYVHTTHTDLFEPHITLTLLWIFGHLHNFTVTVTVTLSLWFLHVLKFSVFCFSTFSSNRFSQTFNKLVITFGLLLNHKNRNRDRQRKCHCNCKRNVNALIISKICCDFENSDTCHLSLFFYFLFLSLRAFFIFLLFYFF